MRHLKPLYCAGCGITQHVDLRAIRYTCGRCVDLDYRPSALITPELFPSASSASSADYPATRP